MEDLTKKTVKSASVQTIVTIGTAAVTLVSFAILSRLLSKEDFGIYAIITAITTVFYVLTEAGMGSAVIQRDSFSKSYFDTAFTLSLYLGVGFSALLYLSSGFLSSLISENDITIPLRLMSISILFCSLNSVLMAYLTRKLQFKRIGIYTIVAYILAATVAIAMAYMGYGVYAVVAQSVLNNVFTFFIFYFHLEEKPTWFVLRKEYVKDIVFYSGWLTASSILRTIYQQMDKFCMSAWYPLTLLGAYNRPNGFITQVSTNLNGIFDTILFPILSSIQTDKEKIRKAFSKLLYTINLYACVLCLCFMYASKTIIEIFFGPEWNDIIPIFNILSLILLFSINGRIMDCFIRSLAYVKMGFYLRILACIISISCLYLARPYGIYGIAIGMVTIHTVVAFTKLVYISYKIDYKISKVCIDILKAERIAVIPLIAFILVYHQISSNTLWSIISTIGVLIYFIFVIFCIPGVLGDELSGILYEKMPILKKFLIKVNINNQNSIKQCDN